MKIILLNLLVILFSYPAFSQISSQKIYTINQETLWNLGDKNRGDTTDITDAAFTVKLDAARMGQDSIVRSAKQIVNSIEKDLTGLDVGTALTVSKAVPLTLSFILSRVVNKQVTDTLKKTSITYKLNNETLTKVVIMGNLADEIIELGKTGKVLKYSPPEDSLNVKDEPDTINIKEVRVVFLLRGEVKTAQEKQNEEMITMVKKILSGSGTKQAIGWFTLKKDFINVYWKDSVQKLYEKNLPIKVVRINVANGAISKKGISVQLNNGDSMLFRNQQSPITIYGLRHRNDKLYIENDPRKLYIRLGELFYYNYKGKFHYPDNDSASLTPGQTVDSIYNYTEFNDVIDVTVYTDLLALVGRKPNGILQTQLSGNFITNARGVIPNADIISFNFVQPYFRLSKFDSRFAQIDSTIIKDDTIHNKLFLTQVSYLQAGIKANFLRIGVGSNQEFLINGGIDINLTSADSLFKKDISFVNYYPEIVYRINGMENFGLDLSVKWIYQAYAKNSPFVNKENIWIFNPQVTAYYSPFTNRNSKIYLRYANFAEIDAGKYNFGQFQFGLKTNLFKNE